MGERVVVLRMPCTGRLALECGKAGCKGHMRRVLLLENRGTFAPPARRKPRKPRIAFRKVRTGRAIGAPRGTIPPRHNDAWERAQQDAKSLEARAMAERIALAQDPVARRLRGR
jgi:hypothetical protein